MSWRGGWWLDSVPLVRCVSGGATGGLAAGKYYFEVTALVVGSTVNGGYGILVGIANENAVLVSTVLTTYNNPQSRTEFASVITARGGDALDPALGWGYPQRPAGISGGAATANDVYGIAVDTINKRIWQKNITRGTNWNSDASWNPSTGTGGNDFSSGSATSPVTGRTFIICGATNDGVITNKGKGTVNFGASAFAGALPTNFVSPHSVASGLRLSASDNSNLTLTNGGLTFEAVAATGTGTQLYGLANPDDQYGAFNCVRSNFAILQS